MVGCQSNNDYQFPIVVPPPPNVMPPNKAPSFIPTPQPTFIPYMPYSVAQKNQKNERKTLTFIVK